MSALDDILAAKRQEVSALNKDRSVLETAATQAPELRDFLAALNRDDNQLSAIAEIKRRSPSKGVLDADLDAAQTAVTYTYAGADALSVLTEEGFFSGTPDDLVKARAAVSVPVLRKDFLVDEIQVIESRSMGADAILLIVLCITDDALLRTMYETGTELGMTVLVEVTNEYELERAMSLEPDLVGVNSRDLVTFEEDLGVLKRLVPYIPSEVTAVAESAIRIRTDAEHVAELGFDAILVGEALVRAPNRAVALRDLVGGIQRKKRR